MIAQIIASTVVLASGQAAAGSGNIAFPSVEWLQAMEALKVDAPTANPTRVPGHYVVEFGSAAEVRNVACAWSRPDRRAECRYERRIRPFLGELGAWESTTANFDYSSRHGWSATIPMPAR
jgi:hypothetical protein